MITHMSCYRNLHDEKVDRSSFPITQNPTFNDSTHCLLCIKAHHLCQHAPPNAKVPGTILRQLVNKPILYAICRSGLRRQVVGEESYENLMSRNLNNAAGNTKA